MANISAIVRRAAARLGTGTSRAVAALQAGAAAALMMIGSADAAPVTFVFNVAPTVTGSGFGNSYAYTSGGLTVTVTAWSFNGTTYVPAQVVLAPAGQQGLGVCNTVEGVNCGDAGTGNVDNVSESAPEFLLFQLSALVSFSSSVIDPFNVGGSPDRDVSYFVGSPAVPGDGLNGETLASIATLFGGAATTVDNPTGSDNLTFLFSGNPTGTALLMGAAIGQSNDNFRVDTLTVEAVAVAEPMTVAVLGAGLLGLAGATRRRRRLIAR